MLRRKSGLRLFLLLLILVFFFPGGALALVGEDEVLLVWIGDGSVPGRHTAANPGQLVLMDSSGEISRTVMPLPTGTSRVVACGSRAKSPDGLHFAFYVGLDTGTLYLMNGTANPVAIDNDFRALGCVGLNALKYSPDSQRLAALAYKPNADTNEYPDGALHLVNTTAGDVARSFENVTAFDLDNDQLVFLRFYATDRGEADEVGVFTWNGNEEQEVATFYADEGCKFTSGQVGLASDRRVMILMGHRCRTGDTRTSWRVYVLDRLNRRANMVLTDFQTGSFLSFSSTNNLIFSPDATMTYFTVPDGVTSNTVAVIGISMDDLTTTRTLISGDAVMAKLDTRPYDFARNAYPVLSSDNRWLAVVTNPVQNVSAVTVLDLTAPQAERLVIETERREDVVVDMLFTPDHTRLIFISGGSEGRQNSLQSLNLTSGAESVIQEGRYGHGVISADGEDIAVMEWKIANPNLGTTYLALSLVSLANGQTTALFEGAEVVNGRIENQRFAYPLAWLGGN